jgi:hypothetical protein
VSENCAETRLSCRLAPYWKAYRRLLMGAGTPYGEALPKNLVAIEAAAVYCSRPEGQNGNSG